MLMCGCQRSHTLQQGRLHVGRPRKLPTDTQSVQAMAAASSSSRAKRETRLRHEPEEQLPKKACGIGMCRRSMGLEGEGGKARTGRQNLVESCGEPRISTAAGTNANGVHAISIRFAAGRPGCDPRLTSAATAHLGERQSEDLRVPGSIPGFGVLGWGACAS